MFTEHSYLHRFQIQTSDFCPDDIPLMYTENAMGEFPPEARDLCLDFISSAKGLSILNRAHKNIGAINEIDWDYILTGAVFEAIAMNERGKNNCGNGILLGPSHVANIYTRLFSGKHLMINRLNGLDFGIQGISIPDGLIIRETVQAGQPVWILDTIIECKTRILPESFKQAAALRNPAFLAKNLLLDTKSGPGKIGHIIGKIIETEPRKLVLNPGGVSLEYLVPVGVKVPIKNVATTTIPISRRDFVRFSGGLFQDLRAAA